MQAQDVMTTDVVSVSRESSVRHIARTMLRHRISAVPVIDDADRLVGIVSEGDLIQRRELGARRTSWWLGLLDLPDAAALDYVKSSGNRAQDVMTANVITVEPDTPLSQIAALLEKEQIKRVPVLKQGRVVGIVSRADLLHAIITASEDQTAFGDQPLRLAIVTRLRDEAGFRDGELDVTVSDGVVHLWGSVRSEARKQAASVAVSTVRGVRGLVDHTRVEDTDGVRVA